MSKPFIRPARLEDIAALAENMRKEDVAECFHSSRRTPLDALMRASSASTAAFAIERQGKVAALFGVVGAVGVAGSPWMLGTDDLRRCRSLLRECRERLDAYLLEYRYLTNAVWSKNEVHIEWIKWLGFQFEGSDIRNGETFLHFHRSTLCASLQRS